MAARLLRVKQASREALAYVERLRGLLPRRFQEMREGHGHSRYALSQKSGVSRDMIGCLENGNSIPSLHVAARLADGMDVTQSSPALAVSPVSMPRRFFVRVDQPTS